MSDEPLYPHPDRGHFRVARLNDHNGLQINANCRIKEVSVFNFLSDLRYAIVGYTLEHWPADSLPPHLGGTAQEYVPKNRPNVRKLYLRTKPSLVRKMLYLEDAIINDFLSKKAIADPMSLQSYSQEAAEQVTSASVWRALERKSPYAYANAVHITRLEATADTPLTIVSQGLRFDWQFVATPDQSFESSLADYPFDTTRACYDRILSHIQSEVANGSHS